MGLNFKKKFVLKAYQINPRLADEKSNESYVLFQFDAYNFYSLLDCGLKVYLLMMMTV